MLKYAIISALFLVGFAQADEKLNKSDIKKIYFMKDSSIIFELKDDSYYRGQILTPDCLKGKKYFESKNTIRNTFKVTKPNGFKTCEFSELKRMAWLKYHFGKLNHIMKSGRLTKVVKLSGLN